MNYTRVDPKKLRHAVTTAVAKLNEAHDALAPVLALLTAKQREKVPRVRDGIPAAARSLAAASARHPELLALCDEYDAEAIIEDLDNVEAVALLDAAIARIQQMADDSRLLWLAEAYIPTLELYGVAKVRAKKDPALEADIAPLAEVLATPRKAGLSEK